MASHLHQQLNSLQPFPYIHWSNEFTWTSHRGAVCDKAAAPDIKQTLSSQLPSATSGHEYSHPQNSPRGNRCVDNTFILQLVLPQCAVNKTLQFLWHLLCVTSFLLQLCSYPHCLNLSFYQ